MGREYKKYHSVNWEAMSKPKSLGGLGIGNLVARNGFGDFHYKLILYAILSLEASWVAKPMGWMLKWGWGITLESMEIYITMPSFIPSKC